MLAEVLVHEARFWRQQYPQRHAEHLADADEFIAGLRAPSTLLDRPLPSPEDEAAVRVRSGLLTNAGKRLADLGRRDQALQATAEAVRLTLPLVERCPHAFLDRLRNRLQNLRQPYAELDHDPDADPLVRQATELLARLEPGP